MGLVPDEGDDHAVQIEEEEDQMEAELGERFLNAPPRQPPTLRCACCSAYLLVDIELSENLGRVKEMGVIDNPTTHVSDLLAIAFNDYPLLDVPSEEWQVEDQREPVSVDKEHEGQETMDSDFGDDVGVEAVAEVNRVDVVTGQRKVSVSLWDAPEGGALRGTNRPYHSKSLYMIVKKTWRKRLTAFTSTAKRYNHASPDILADWNRGLGAVIRLGPEVDADRGSRLDGRWFDSDAGYQRLRTPCVLDRLEMRVL